MDSKKTHSTHKASSAKTPYEQTALDRQLSTTDTQIDRLVYGLCGMTGMKIKLVTDALNPIGDFFMADDCCGY